MTKSMFKIKKHQLGIGSLCWSSKNPNHFFTTGRNFDNKLIKWDLLKSAKLLQTKTRNSIAYINTTIDDLILY